jgi:membrane protein
VGLIIETPTEDALVSAYIPSTDINHITVRYFFNKMDQFGSENFKIDSHEKLKNIWDKIVEIKNINTEKEGNILLKDI